MNLSFIIPMRDAKRTIRLCLDAIFSELEPGDEVVVVDNNSKDGSATIVSHEYPAAKVIPCPTGSIAAVRNAGASLSRGEVLCFIDSDCVISASWRKEVVETLRESEVAAVGSRVTIPKEAAWIERAWYSQTETTCSKVKYVNSGNFVIKRVVFDEAKGFCEDLVTGEDSELGWRLNEKGYLILNNPKVKSIHLGNPKNLTDFYHKEVWHGLGMMGTFHVSRFDKPLIMTIAFIMANIMAVGLVINAVVHGAELNELAVAATVSLAVPAMTAVYRVVTASHQTRYLLHLMVLYFLYFTARAQALVILCVGKGGAEKPV